MLSALSPVSSSKSRRKTESSIFTVLDFFPAMMLVLPWTCTARRTMFCPPLPLRIVKPLPTVVFTSVVLVVSWVELFRSEKAFAIDGSDDLHRFAGSFLDLVAEVHEVDESPAEPVDHFVVPFVDRSGTLFEEPKGARQSL